MRYLIYTVICVVVLSFSSCASKVLVEQPASVTVVKKLPRQYKVVRVKGKRYYYFNGRHHRKARGGYVVVKLN